MRLIYTSILAFILFLLSISILNRRLNTLSTEKKDIKIVDHIYQPKHEILSKEEADLIFKKFNSKPSQLPYIMSSDKGIQGLVHNRVI